MNSRERILAALNGAGMDRMPITEIGVWPETEARWRNEGLPKRVAMADYFSWDKLALFSYEPSLQLLQRIEEETAEHRIVVDGDGCRYKQWKQVQSPPQLLGSSIRSQEDWNRLKSRLNASLERFEDYAIDFVFGLPAQEMPRPRYLFNPVVKG